MNWRNVKLIWQREMRDQLRDRRTLFMVAVLPMLMYPLLGTSFFQLSQFMRRHTAQVAVVGHESLQQIEALDPLFDGERFSVEHFDRRGEASLLAIELIEGDPGEALAEQGRRLADREIDVLLTFPEGFADRLTALLDGTADRSDSGFAIDQEIPEPIVLYNSSSEPSQVARLRVERVLQRWRQRIVRDVLTAQNIPIATTKPFGVQRQDIADEDGRDAVLWSKLLPFIVFVWALTGAFYPAIDLCAGEKERGTLETLLASPARRSEIVSGKLLTVISFSLFTAVLNLIGMSVTASMVLGQLEGLAPGGGMSLSLPPFSAMLWILVALVPMAALFSALSLACAAYARSTKEGQYYFMPLFLGAMPLMLMPMSPGVELNLGNSFVPVMGLVLLLRTLIEGQTALALAHLLPAVFTTAICCWLATRWAVSQFNQESVLFRETERFSLRGWLASTFRKTEPTPTATAAMICVAGVFLMQFAFRQAVTFWPPEVASFGYFSMTHVLNQALCIAGPALLVAVLLCKDLRASLMLRRSVAPYTILLAVALAVVLNPAGQLLAVGIERAYPLSEEMAQEIEGLSAMLDGSPSILVTLLLLAALPALCEEIAFRGVVLQGLRKSLGDAGAVVISSALFGAAHLLLQQSLAAAIVGAVIGMLAIRSGSLWCCMAFHATYNSLSLLTDKLQGPLSEKLAAFGLDRIVFQEIEPGLVCYSPAIAILGAAVGLVIVRGIRPEACGLPHPRGQVRTAS